MLTFLEKELKSAKVKGNFSGIDLQVAKQITITIKLLSNSGTCTNFCKGNWGLKIRYFFLFYFLKIKTLIFFCSISIECDKEINLPYN